MSKRLTPLLIGAHDKEEAFPFFVVLADLRSRENVGSIFRTADAAGVSKIFLCGITPMPPHPKISKTALGAEESVPWEYHKQTWRVLENFKKEGHLILALEQTAQSKSVFSYTHDLEFEPDQSRLKYFPKKVVKDSQKNFQSDQKEEVTSSTKSFDGERLPKGIVLVLGNEVKGISKSLLDYASDAVEIPMKGTKESLNVAVAFGIAVYALKAK